MRFHLFCQTHVYKMPKNTFKRVGSILECTPSSNWNMKPPSMMTLALGLTLKGILKVQFRLISPLMKSSVVLASLQ